MHIFDGDNIWVGKIVNNSKLGQTLIGDERPKNYG